MDKIIKTSSGELLNFSHILELRPVEGEGVNSAGKSATMYGITAVDILAKERDIAVYETEKEMNTAFETLVFFLTASTQKFCDLGESDE